MNFLEALDLLEKNTKLPTDAFLSYGFIMVDPNIKQEWQIGYYSKKSDKMITYSVGEKIQKNPETEVFRKGQVKKLIKKNIKIDYSKAIEIAKKVQKKKYSSYQPKKEIVIIQNLDLGQVWNISFITQSFKTLNIKIDSVSGKVLKDDLIEIFDFSG